MTAIIDYFSKRKEKIECKGKKLIDHQKIAEKIVALAKDSNYPKILLNAIFIL